MQSFEPEVVAQLERLNLEIEDVQHKLEKAENEEAWHELDAHRKHLEEQITELKRRLPN